MGLTGQASALDDFGLLAPGDGALEPPIRSVLFGQARFEQHGRSLARTHEVVAGQMPGQGFFPRLKDNIAVLRRAGALLERQAREGQYLGPAATWLLDNAALLNEQSLAIRQGLPRGFFRLLPRLRDDPLAGLPRVYGVAWAWVAHTDSGFDAGLLEAYLQAYREVRELSLAELWALPTTLRVVLVENLRRLAERAAVQQAAREAAHHWFDQANGAPEISALDALHARTQARGVADAFLLMLQQRQSELPPEQAEALVRWLQPRLADTAGAQARQQNEATEDQQSVRNAITTLRHLDRMDWRSLFARASTVMQLLQTCPVHAAERDDTQDATMHAVERLARSARCSETDVARALLRLTEQHSDAGDARAAPAYWWRGPGENSLRKALGMSPRLWPRPATAAYRQLATWAYLCGLAVLSVGGVAWVLQRAADPAAPPWLLALAGVLLLGPVSEAVVAVVNRVISESAAPTRLPRLAFDGGIPAEHRVLVVVPCMLTDAAAVAELAAQLEQHHLANPERHAQFALLSDWADADQPTQDSDGPLLAAAQAAIEELNRRHPAGTAEPLRFLLLHRGREWSATEGRFIGWERKRGKLEQLLRALVEPGHRPFAALGALAQPAAGTRYIVTLDSDTDMPPGRLRDLAGVAAHPLNLPRVDAAGRRVVSGYGILQPRVMTPLPAPATVTWYHWLFSGQTGIDPYSAASSEIYQDVFGEGTFTGKGLLHVQALHQVLVGRLPEGQVLSHDLLEGAIARCAGVSDVTVIEDAPVHADVAASRLHRWTRGDWQLLPFVVGAASVPVAAISRWKMLDNLRRSLVVPLSLALLLLVLATGVLPAGFALVTVAAAFSAGPLLGALAGLAPSRDDIALRRFYRLAGADLLRALLLPLWQLAQLLQLGLLYGDAIGRALHRQFVSRRHLLQWTTAAAAQAAARSTLTGLWQAHRRVPLVAGGLLSLLCAAALLGAPVAWPAALALPLLWAASPLWTWAVSRPRVQRQQKLDAASRDYLHGVARDTWRYYERHVTTADNDLPPDNVQQQPYTLVAHRTSPTNIGIYLLAAACARELGFIGHSEFADRLAATLATLDKMPRHRGHFYNWYDTQTLAVLPPAYLSTVDSGNCSVHLLAVAAACDTAVPDADGPQSAIRLSLAQALQRLRPLQPVLAGAPGLRTLAELAAGRWQWPADAQEALALQDRVQRAGVELDGLKLGRSEQDDDGSMWLLHDLLATLSSALADQSADRSALRARLRALGVRARRMALEADYAMLYDRQRKLLCIGYRVDSGQLDGNHYDLLASEARLTSLLAIAKGDVPVQHWAALGRPFFAEGTEVGLKSWSGSMFEYLMPSLVLAEPIGSVLQQVLRSAVAEQQREGRERGTPWGISESAIAGQDHTLAYQYGPQGVAALALRRTPPEERVVAPYASAMAVMVAPASAVENLRALQALGARGAFGFIEALDYSQQRQTGSGPFVPVQTFMAHHQAMSLVAITNVLAGDAPRRWAAADPWLRAVNALLHERAPREVPVLLPPAPTPTSRRVRVAHAVLDCEPLAEALPATQLLTNGRHAVMLRSHGGGASQWDGVGLTRWRDDLLRDTSGTFFYLQREGDPARRSLTAHPAADPTASYHCRMQTDRVVFDARWPDLDSRCTVWVSPEDDCELRQISLTNTGSTPLALTLCMAAEVTLAPQRADEAHPAFSNLFIQARWDAGERALYLRRQPRLAEEQAMQAVHFLALAEGPLDSVTVCTDRARWLGRYGNPAAPLGDGGATALPQAAAAELAAGVQDLPPGVLMDTGVDPVAVISVRLRLAPGASTELTFCCAAARDGDQLGALVDKYRQPSHVARASSMSHTMAGIRLRELQFDADTWTAMLHLNTLITALATREGALLPFAPRQQAGNTLRCDRRLLWRHGLSGDRPMLLVTINSEAGLGLVQTLKRALRLWAGAGLGVDLVVINGEPASYLSPVQNQLQQLAGRLLGQHDERVPAERRAALHLLREQALNPDERHTLQTLARLRLHADARPLAQQLERLIDEHRRDAQARSAMPALRVLELRPQGSPQAGAPPQGRFASSGGDFSFEMDPAHHPSRPWINVLANPAFGSQVSEVAGGYTWAGNSRMHQITGWSNDALSDPASEWLLLHDLERGRVWPLGRRLTEGAPREVTHGLGFTRMRQQFDGVTVTLCWCVDVQAAVKQVQVLVQCDGPRPRRLRLVAMAEWTMGSARQERLSLATRADRVAIGPEGAGLPTAATALALQATQLDHLGGFGDATAFLAWRPTQPGDAAAASAAMSATQAAADDWTCDRREFFDSAGRMVLPGRLGRQSGAGLDPCAALGCVLSPAPGRAASVTLLLGHAASAQEASALVAQAFAMDPSQRLAAQRRQWPHLIGGVQVQTPDARFDALVNHWLPYQTLACRLWARAGFYQAGGAFGFRDQLQDSMAMVTRAPQLLAQQIRANAARQFPEGDVQHWWHAPGGAGVRTHFSDDLLWLPLALALYVQRTGDRALLDEALPFLNGAPVPPGAEDLYETPATGDETATLYEHAARAIDRSLAHGEHGLPLFGTGDWNDGMNRVGHQGRGESVWLAWFLCQVVDDFLPIAATRGDDARVAAWRSARQGWATALDGAAWDGQWYRRGFFDDGMPLGAAANAECRIDLIAQAWAVLSGAGDPQRARQAMASAQKLLLDGAANTVKLLDPPLQHAVPSAGYIQAYPPGVRENGGQYNHGAVWALMALARLGDAAGAWKIFTALSPAHRWADAERGAAYAIEPYVMAGDVYTQPPWVGRGGWSWYTGAAGWLMRAAVESLCGVVLAAGRVTVTPCLPPHWPQASVTLRHAGRSHRLVVCADEAAARAACQSEPAAQRAAVGQAIELAALADGSVHVVVAGAPAAAAGAAADPATARAL